VKFSECGDDYHYDQQYYNYGYTNKNNGCDNYQIIVIVIIITINMLIKLIVY